MIQKQCTHPAVWYGYECSELQDFRLTRQEVHVGTPIDRCREINDQKLKDEGNKGGYQPDLFDNLVFRYEEPNGMNRWDSPLFTVPFDDENPPFEQIWETMIESEGKAKIAKPNLATVAVRMHFMR